MSLCLNLVCLNRRRWTNAVRRRRAARRFCCSTVQYRYILFSRAVPPLGKKRSSTPRTIPSIRYKKYFLAHRFVRALESGVSYQNPVGSPKDTYSKIPNSIRIQQLQAEGQGGGNLRMTAAGQRRDLRRRQRSAGLLYDAAVD